MVMAMATAFTPHGLGSPSCLLSSSSSSSSSLTRILCLAGLFTLIFSQETTGSIAANDCVDPNNRQATYRVRRGDITTVCLYVGPSGSWNSNIDYKRFSVNLISDEFSSYEIPGCKMFLESVTPLRIFPLDLMYFYRIVIILKHSLLLIKFQSIQCTSYNVGPKQSIQF